MARAAAIVSRVHEEHQGLIVILSYRSGIVRHGSL